MYQITGFPVRLAMLEPLGGSLLPKRRGALAAGPARGGVELLSEPVALSPGATWSR